jgi:hypothetical protein
MDSKSVTLYSRSLYAIVLVAALASPASAKSPIYRCMKDGQTVLTDTPCDETSGTSSSGPVATPSDVAVGHPVSAPESVIGEWRGQIQFQGAENGRELQEAHSVVPMVLTFSGDSKVSGKSADNGCQFLGLWSPGVTPRLFMLDITLSGCRYPGLNRRYSGTVTTAHIDGSAQLALQAYAVPILGQPTRGYDVEATLRR